MSNFDHFRSKITYSRPVQLYLSFKAVPRGPTSFEFPALRKAHYFSMLVGAGILAANFYAGMMVIDVRKETFSRNLSLLEAKYGKEHRESFGEGTSVSKYGYPDMGGNLYADLLPYKDWVRLNSA